MMVPINFLLCTFPGTSDQTKKKKQSNQHKFCHPLLSVPACIPKVPQWEEGAGGERERRGDSYIHNLLGNCTELELQGITLLLQQTVAHLGTLQPLLDLGQGPRGGEKEERKMKRKVESRRVNYHICNFLLQQPPFPTSDGRQVGSSEKRSAALHAAGPETGYSHMGTTGRGHEIS